MPTRCLRYLSGRLPLAILAALVGTGASAQWVEFVDQTPSRLSVDASLGENDTEEKDYAWGDVDKDGDIDLVIVRKEPFTSAGQRTNLLLLNENGVLVDRTLEYATLSDRAGDLGFHTPTNDRDVLLVDLDNDGWLDIVTAVTISDGARKHVGHPRIYVNLGDDPGTGDWLGFRHEDARIPEMLSYTGLTGQNPRFCSVAAGDVTGDGYPDLWFGDYDSSGAGGNEQPEGADFNDRLLVNDGNGFFTDVTSLRFAGAVPGIGQPFEVSAFGAAVAIEDMNGDGVNDIVKQTSLNAPLYVGIAYNNVANVGFFDTYEVVNDQSPYFITVGDLNNDSLPDIVVTDDGADRYMLNQGNGPDGLADFTSFGFAFDAASDDGFGGNNLIADLNNDGWNDVLIADVDVDIGGCTRRMHLYRNLGGTSGADITLQEQTTGAGCATNDGNPASCVIAGIPSNLLEGVHDMAIFDIDGDGWKDMVLGRCNGTEVYMNVPPVGLTFGYPVGLPLFVDPGQSLVFQVQVNSFGGAAHEPGTGKMFASVAGAGFVEVPLVDLGGDLYEATLPAAADCIDSIEFYFTADASAGGGSFADPPGAPGDSFRAIAALGTEVSLEDDIEGDVSGWTVVSDPSLASGAWEQAIPVGSLTGGGQQAAPDEDAEASTSQVHAFVTENGAPGGSVGAADVDGGPTDLISPVIDLAGTDAEISYVRWFYSSADDVLEISVTANGSDWVVVEIVEGASNSWTVSSFTVSDFVTPSATVQVRFRADDSPNDSLAEAAIDLFRVERFVCEGCSDAGECDDGSFCNGAEQCSGGSCVPGGDPCPGQPCDEATDSCVECLVDLDCDDGDFCNGAESCSANVCVAASAPCPGQSCDEILDSCVDCLVDLDCDDGLFCSGAESCSGGACVTPADPCPGRLCDEADDVCVGTIQIQERMGQPLRGLAGDEVDRFFAGRTAFDTVFSVGDGLGPIFNQNSCGSCHNRPLGGSGSILVTRFGFNDDKGGGFDPLANLGGSLRQAEATAPECQEQVPPEANVTAQRLTNSTLGFGLVESIADADIEFFALNPPAGVDGRVHMVENLEAPGPLHVGRFGWKAQLATVLSFSGDAALNEMGITNRLVGVENAPNGDLALLATCDTVPDPEDGPDGEGFDFIDRVTDFQRFLAPPPQTPRSAMSGETGFGTIGCASCHVATYTTADDPLLEDAIRDRVIHPYSDFLLHDMGQTADFIEQGAATARELRTPPLWGLRVRDPLWHDGRVAGGTFESRVLAAIVLHDALQSEGQVSAQAFAALLPAEKEALVAFMDSLGRAEFDHDGDNDVDLGDLAATLACRTGPGSFYDADDPCSIADADQDGDVDDDDIENFLAASGGLSGAVPDGDASAGVPLTIDAATGGDLTLTWSASCSPLDDDYEIYEGTIGNFASHVSMQCTTGGATEATVAPGGGSVYFLVVPTNGLREGSYGLDSRGDPRPQGAAFCREQSAGVCG